MKSGMNEASQSFFPSAAVWMYWTRCWNQSHGGYWTRWIDSFGQPSLLIEGDWCSVTLSPTWGRKSGSSVAREAPLPRVSNCRGALSWSTAAWIALTWSRYWSAGIELRLREFWSRRHASLPRRLGSDTAGSPYGDRGHVGPVVRIEARSASTGG